MSDQAPTREAVIIHTKDNRPVVDFDPIDLPVDRDGYTDPYDYRLCLVVPQVSSSWLAGDDIALVWSDDLTPVRALCPNCDQIFQITFGQLDDDLLVDYDYVVCC